MDCEIVCVVGGDKGLQEIGLFVHLFWIAKYRIGLFSIDFEGAYGYKAFVRRRLSAFSAVRVSVAEVGKESSS
jgi:hypothetical protein